jgi:uncharacterized membrane protein YfcA
VSAEYWFLLPVGCAIAVLAMSSGVSAGNFWVPVYLLWTRFDAPLAFWMALATIFCGYGSGVTRNLRQGTIHRGLIVRYLPLTVPAALVGGYLSPSLDVSWLILLFGVFVFGYGARMLAQSQGLLSTPSTPRQGVPWDIGIPGGVLYGLISVGLGELMLPRMLADPRLSRPADAVGSAVLVIFVTSVAAALVRLNGPFVNALVDHQEALLSAILFAGPGVIVGGQLGPMIARQLNARALRLYVSILLLLVGVLMLVRFGLMAGLFA